MDRSNVSQPTSTDRSGDPVSSSRFYVRTDSFSTHSSEEGVTCMLEQPKRSTSGPHTGPHRATSRGSSPPTARLTRRDSHAYSNQDALDDVLYEILDNKHFAAEDENVSERHL